MSKKKTYTEVIKNYTKNLNASNEQVMKEFCEFDRKLSEIQNNQIFRGIKTSKILRLEYKGEKPTPNEVIILNYEECMRKAQQYNNQK